uniref:Uncharacterized protein n=1 Tax=viral metagenome TaxID=1070528 RepID=A0A6C0CJ09_9ZZZZ
MNNNINRIIENQISRLDAIIQIYKSLVRCKELVGLLDEMNNKINELEDILNADPKNFNNYEERLDEHSRSRKIFEELFPYMFIYSENERLNKVNL